jgi:ABC-2 type transport system permease protein
MLALGWQALAVMALVKGGSLLFRKRVMKSGGAGRVKKARFARGAQAVAEPAE